MENAKLMHCKHDHFILESWLVKEHVRVCVFFKGQGQQAPKQFQSPIKVPSL